MDARSGDVTGGVPVTVTSGAEVRCRPGRTGPTSTSPGTGGSSTTVKDLHLLHCTPTGYSVPIPLPSFRVFRVLSPLSHGLPGPRTSPPPQSHRRHRSRGGVRLSPSESDLGVPCGVVGISRMRCGLRETVVYRVVAPSATAVGRSRACDPGPVD